MAAPAEGQQVVKGGGRGLVEDPLLAHRVDRGPEKDVGRGRPDIAQFADSDIQGRVLLFTFFAELAEPVRKLAHVAWAARGKLARDVKAYIMLLTGMVCSMPGRVSRVVNNPRLQKLVVEEEDPQALAAVVCGTSGALLIGSVGAVVGATMGGGVGVVLGAVPAIFTLGLSLPIGAALGSATGLVTGAAIGGSAGLAGGATSGITAAYFRDEIVHATLHVVSRVYDAYDVLVVRPVAAVKSTGRRVSDSVHSSSDYTRAKAQAVGAVVQDIAADQRVRVSAASAATGAAALGTAGAAGGALAGGAAGAVVGLVPALFTFGLSIPIGAVVGGSAGLCVGGAAGTTTGFASGGALGFLGYTYRGLPAGAWRLAAAAAEAAAVQVHLRPEKLEKEVQ